VNKKYKEKMKQVIFVPSEDPCVELMYCFPFREGKFYIVPAFIPRNKDSQAVQIEN